LLHIHQSMAYAQKLTINPKPSKQLKWFYFFHIITSIVTINSSIRFIETLFGNNFVCNQFMGEHVVNWFNVTLINKFGFVQYCMKCHGNLMQRHNMKNIWKMEKFNLSTKQCLMGMYHVMCYNINIYNYHCPPTHEPNNIN
jgi:hypothetical protein